APAWLLTRPLAWLVRSVQLGGQVLLMALMHLIIQVGHQLWTTQQQHLDDLSWHRSPALLRSLDLALTALSFLAIHILLRSLASLVILFAPRLPLQIGR